MRILITGATGFIGKRLGVELVRAGHEILVISRSSEEARRQLPFPCDIIEGDLMKGALQETRLAGVEGVVHLLGESIAGGRWTTSRKERILKSRTVATRNLIESLHLSGASAKLKVIVSSSGVGFYGDRGDDVLTEESSEPASPDFLSKVCLEWEASALSAKNAFPSVRVVCLRLGVVLAAHGGALLKMIPAFRWGLGGAIGSGEQWMSWIHLDDAVRLFAHALSEAKLSGPVNAAAPDGPVMNREFSRQLAGVFGKRLGPAVPAAVLKLGVGEMSVVLLGSQRVLPKRALESGFEFRYPTLEKAFKEIGSYYDKGGFVFYTEQYLPRPVEEVFPFYADARNLEKITPPTLNFHIEKVSTPEMQVGTLIDYKLKIRGVPVSWRTRIADWEPGRCFVDSQEKGPYTLWHHTHTFEPLGKGTLMKDIVQYRVPFGALGWAASGWLVASDVEKIFGFRRKACAEIFS